MKRLLCWFGIHWSGTVDGGLMGDAMCCDVCGQDKYTESFKGILLHQRLR